MTPRATFDLADSYRRRPILKTGIEAVHRLREFSAALRYKGSFEGRIIKNYTVIDF